MGRRIGICSVCAEDAQTEMAMDQPDQQFIEDSMQEKELLAHGMCAKHYRRYEREKNAARGRCAARGAHGEPPEKVPQGAHADLERP